jgi:malate dehydrogenase (oxaloacetate-decarboxylating)
MSSLQAPAGLQPSASYSFTMRIELRQLPGAFAAVANAIGHEGAILGAIDLVRVDQRGVTRDVTIACVDAAHGERVVNAVRALDGVNVSSVSDRTFLMHKGGKIEIVGKVPIKTRDDLSMAYTPGVARVSSAIHEDPDSAWTLTIKGHTVAVVSDGTAVLGLGDIGPEAAMPVMEGKAMLFKELAGVDAFPLCLNTKDVDEIVRIVEGVAPTFGGINLEDIAAPRCFEIERRLRDMLDIPVFHDDQHGTAIVVLAALTNALRVVGKQMSDVKVVVSGAGAAGTAIMKLLLAQGVGDIIACDRMGALHPDLPGLNSSMQWLADNTNKGRYAGSVQGALAGADVFIGVSAPNILTGDDIATMAAKAIVFALANPDPEVDPADARKYAAVVATGRSDQPNQINNVLAFPGVFRGLLDAQAKEYTVSMGLAAATAIADVVGPERANASYIVPSVFDPAVAPAVAAAVKNAALGDGVPISATAPVTADSSPSGTAPVEGQA